MELNHIAERLKKIAGNDAVIHASNALIAYECDALTVDRDVPDMVIIPRTTEQVVEIVKVLHNEQIPFVPRGAGTGLSGGALTVGGGVILSTTRLNQILNVDIRNRRALVEPGVVNLNITKAVQAQGYHFAPDPSSQGACTVGGNINNNSGGPHTLKYGVTVNHVLSVQVVLPNGELVWLGGESDSNPGYDLTGAFVGSEGTFGVVVKAWVKLTRLPAAHRTMLAVFDRAEDAISTISEIIAAGIIPAALEMLDVMAIKAVEEAFNVGLPLDAGAVLIIELDGLEAGLDSQMERVLQICRETNTREVRHATTDSERGRLWTARKRAFGALGRLSPNYLTQDGVVPRTKLPQIMEYVYSVGKKYNVGVANVFHAGDGNTHPCILYNESDPDSVNRALQASTDIIVKCIELGGSVTGEHGIGIEKQNLMPLMFSEDDLNVMAKVKSAFNPDGLLNPKKVFPTNKGCIEIAGMRKAAAL